MGLYVLFLSLNSESLLGSNLFQTVAITWNSELMKTEENQCVAHH